MTFSSWNINAGSASGKEHKPHADVFNDAEGTKVVGGSPARLVNETSKN